MATLELLSSASRAHENEAALAPAQALVVTAGISRGDPQ